MMNRFAGKTLDIDDLAIDAAPAGACGAVIIEIIIIYIATDHATDPAPETPPES